MKNLVTKFALCNAVCFGLTLLSACGDENTTEVTNISGLAILESGKSLPECGSGNAGDMVYVSDSAKVFFCADSKWSTLNGKDGEKGEDGKSETSTGSGESKGCSVMDNDDGSYTLSCDGSEDVIIKNGENGLNAYELSGTSLTLDSWLESLKGNPGEDGRDCSSKENEDGSFTISCPNSNAITIKNGSGCVLDDHGDGTVEVNCGEESNSVTLYKAFCQGKIYDPEKAFCLESGELSSCGDFAFNPATQFCDKRKTQTRPYKFTVIKNGSYEKTWMAENLDYKVDGEKDCIEEKGADYKYCNTYGRFYTWSAAIKEGTCPDGWKLPSNEDWEMLIDAVGGVSVAAEKLEADHDWSTVTGSDDFGFTAFPAGRWQLSAGVNDARTHAFFWSYGLDGESVEAYNVKFFLRDVAFAKANSDYAYNIRCIKK